MERWEFYRLSGDVFLGFGGLILVLSNSYFGAFYPFEDAVNFWHTKLSGVALVLALFGVLLLLWSLILKIKN